MLLSLSIFVNRINMTCPVFFKWKHLRTEVAFKRAELFIVGPSLRVGIVLWNMQSEQGIAAEHQAAMMTDIGLEVWPEMKAQFSFAIVSIFACLTWEIEVSFHMKSQSRLRLFHFSAAIASAFYWQQAALRVWAEQRALFAFVGSKNLFCWAGIFQILLNRLFITPDAFSDGSVLSWRFQNFQMCNWMEDNKIIRMTFESNVIRY